VGVESDEDEGEVGDGSRAAVEMSTTLSIVWGSADRLFVDFVLCREVQVARVNG
jgi:hypothetical protein